MSKLNILLLSAMASSVVLTGCSNGNVKPSTDEDTFDGRTLSTYGESTMDWQGGNYAGAAITKPDYVFVLKNEEPKRLSKNNPYSTTAKQFAQKQADLLAFKTPDYTDELLEKLAKKNGAAITPESEGYNYSTYQMSRWERFCNGGVGMDEADWAFIDGLSFEARHMPPISNCQPAAYSSTTYEGAWSYFCRGKTMTEEGKSIVKNTVKPSSIDCPKL